MKAPDRTVFSRYTDPETFARIREKDSVAEIWRDAAAEFASVPAIVDGELTRTFAELDADAAGFRSLLPAERQRVAILSPNSYDFVKAFLAVVTLGHTAVILPAQLDEKTVFGCCMKFGVKTLICHPALEAKLSVVRAMRPDIAIVMTNAPAVGAVPSVFPAGGDPCVIMFTGGTTGRSKGALLSNRAVALGTVNGCYGIREVFGQRYLLVLPLSHVFGLVRNLLTSLYTGSTLKICRSNQDMFRDIAEFRPTEMVMVPALAEMALTLSRKFGRNMLGADMKTVICGAAAVPPYLISEYRKMGIALLPGYGLTESANLVSGNPETLKKPDSVGIPYAHQEFRVVDGELWIRGENMLISYVGEENAEESFEDGWFKTGDLVRFDEDGFLYITGRKKEIIVLSNGENVSPAEVELHFNALDCVQDSQVFEDVAENGTHFLALEVVPRLTELAGLSPEEIRAKVTAALEEVNATLPPYQRVSRITVRDSDFQRSPAMKIVRYHKC